MPPHATVLITGASRGKNITPNSLTLDQNAHCTLVIGRGLTNKYLTYPNHIIIALVRSTTKEPAQSLTQQDLPTLITGQCDMSFESSIQKAIATLRSEFDMTAVNIVFVDAAFFRIPWPVFGDSL